MQNDKLLRLIQWHIEHHKNVGIQDVYKMLYQGLFGAEHLLNDVERAKHYLDDEWRRVPTDASVPLLEPVSIDGRVVRANFQRCKAESIDVQNMWQVFYASVPKVHAGKTDFAAMWERFRILCRSHKLPFDAGVVAQFTKEVEMQQWPARHHTPGYRAANYPAYRVVLKSEFKRCIDIPLDENDIFY